MINELISKSSVRHLLSLSLLLLLLWNVFEAEGSNCERKILAEKETHD